MALEVISRTANGPATAGRPALLFVHGAYHGAWCWAEHFLPWFAERGWDAHALSLRGHAPGDDSNAKLSWSLADYAADVESVVASMQRPVVLIGHSMGAVVAQLVLKAQASVVGTVMVAATPLRPALSVVLRVLMRHPIDVVRAQGFGDTNAARRALQSSFFDRDLDPALRARYVSQLTAEAPLTELFTRPPPSPDPADRRPMLVIAGRDDQSIPLRDHEVLARAYNGELAVCPGGHDLMLSKHWAATAETIRTWLGRMFERAEG